MISLQKSFLFVHIPKTAGNSIQSVLRLKRKGLQIHMRAKPMAPDGLLLFHADADSGTLGPNEIPAHKFSKRYQLQTICRWIRVTKIRS
jgi:hypothetical protein